MRVKDQHMVELFKEMFPNLWDENFRVSGIPGGDGIFLYPGRRRTEYFMFIVRADGSWMLEHRGNSHVKQPI